GFPIDMVIVALPHKLNCPLKGYGPRPDLAEVDFLLVLREIVSAVEEILARQQQYIARKAFARFTVVCDGDRFADVTRTPKEEITAYRLELKRWVALLKIEHAIILESYGALLERGLPSGLLAEKSRMRAEAVEQYSGIMWPLLDLGDMAGTLRRAALADPDPEPGNAQGRFVSLVKSLAFTINYAAISELPDCSPELGARRYRILVSRLFDQSAYLQELSEIGMPCGRAEVLREAMWLELWQAAISYVAEIKSDRELPRDPVLDCLPGFIRWTIHAKAGQFGLMVSFCMGKPIVPWAGIGYVRKTGKSRVALCTVPRLAAEGGGAVPVFIDGMGEQPFCYLEPAIPAETIDDVLDTFETSVTRRRIR
ncbi:MAG: L-tyrosine/L-tryptophan isonitrile synthase family protein, partial [Pseudomonadota bacterium]